MLEVKLNYTLLAFELEYLPGVLKKKNLKKSFGMNLFKPAKSILAQRSKVHNLVGAYESHAKHLTRCAS